MFAGLRTPLLLKSIHTCLHSRAPQVATRWQARLLCGVCVLQQQHQQHFLLQDLTQQVPFGQVLSGPDATLASECNTGVCVWHNTRPHTLDWYVLRQGKST